MDILLIIDMQIASFEQAERFDKDGVILRINKLSAHVRSSGGKVVFIQHNGRADDGLEPNSRGWKILPSLDMQTHDLVVNKTICDSFYQTSLSEILYENSCKRVIITGCATDFCVDTTIRSAVSHGYEVVVAADGHTTADRPHLSAKNIIEHHNWVWSDLITPEKEVQVLSTDEIVSPTAGESL